MEYTIIEENRPKSNCIYPLHTAKVHVWGGISCVGHTPFYLFEHYLDSEEYRRIITGILTPFMMTFSSVDCRLLQDRVLVDYCRLLKDDLKFSWNNY